MNPNSAASVPVTQTVWIICRIASQCRTFFDCIRVAANLPPISDGRLSLMLQERWEGSVVASIVTFFVAIWNVRSMCRRGVRFLSFIELRDLVLVRLQCPWLVRCCPTRSNKQRRQDRILPRLPKSRSHNLQV